MVYYRTMAQKSQIPSFIEHFLRIITLIIVAWFILANFISGVNLWHIAGLIFAISAPWLIFRSIKKSKPAFLANITASSAFYRLTLGTVLLVGVVARLSFLGYVYDPSCACDPGTFYWNAESLAETGHLHPSYGLDRGATNEQYFAFYPYELSYTASLAASNLIFGGGHLSVVILNLAFDLLGTLLIFLVARRLFPGKKWLWLLTAAIYFLNPFSVVFSALSLPIIAVNTFLVLAIYLVVVLIGKLDQTAPNRRTLPLFALLGLVLGVGNSFRPIFIIALIATILTIIYLALKNRRLRRPALLLGTLLMLATYLASVQLGYLAIDRLTGLRAARSASGWSLYVGSNPETSGRWLPDSPDLSVRRELWAEHGDDMQAVHDQLTDRAIERYRDNGLWGNISLYADKALVSAGDQSGSMYNAYVLVGYPDGPKQAVDSLAELFILSLFVCMIIALYTRRKSLASGTWIFLELLLIGLFVSGLLLEVKNRYFTVLLPAMILLAVLAFYRSRSPK